MTRARDSQRSKFWKASGVMEGVHRKLTLGETKRMLESIRDRKFLARRYPDARLDAHFSFVLGGGRLSAQRYHINIPKCQQTDWNVACMVARMIHYRGDPRWAWFGWEYCSILLDVTRALMGKAAAELLKESFRVNRVRWKPKKTREVTPEMIENLAKARMKARENAA